MSRKFMHLALSAAGLVLLVGGLLAVATELVMWLFGQYWPFITLMDLFSTCVACDSGLAAPWASWLWRQPISLLVASAGLLLLLLGLTFRQDT